MAGEAGGAATSRRFVVAIRTSAADCSERCALIRSSIGLPAPAVAGIAGSQLGYLLNGAGYFHHAHRAVDDCHALLEVPAFELPTIAPALALLLVTARKPTMRV